MFPQLNTDPLVPVVSFIAPATQPGSRGARVVTGLEQFLDCLKLGYGHLMVHYNSLFIFVCLILSTIKWGVLFVKRKSSIGKKKLTTNEEQSEFQALP